MSCPVHTDTYVKVTLMSPTGQELQRCKTSVRRGQPNPLFKETFMLQVALFQLPDVTLMVSVYNKKSMKKKEMIGWFSLGKIGVLSVYKNSKNKILDGPTMGWGGKKKYIGWFLLGL